MSQRLSILVTGAVLATTACSGSSRPDTPVVPLSVTPAIASAVLGGASDGLATELLLAGERDNGTTWHPRQRAVSDPALAAAVDAMALDHVRSTVLGAGTGPALVGSNAVRQLALEPGAPIDRNQRSGNLDETLEAEARRILAFAGAPPPPMETVPMLPWRARSAELAAALPSANAQTGNATEPWRTRDLGDHTVQLDEVAHFLRLRTTAARRLLRDRRPGMYGVDPAAGSLGLLAMQQVLVAEDALFAAFFTSGGALGPLTNPAEYDPLTAPRWLPRTVGVDIDPAVTGAPGGYRPLDGASDLRTLGSMLGAAADLADLADPTATLALPQLFRSTPFELPPATPAPPSISWSRDIGPVLSFRCGLCHLNQTRGGFSIASYETMLTGGNKTRQLNLEFIVPGNAAGSLLHQILVGPPAPFVQMPAAGAVTSEEIALIDAWIDEGALKDPLTAPPPPRPGDDMALVSFRNLAALHLDPATGALHHRYEADGGSGVATALATGRALHGLAGFVRAKPNEMFAGLTSSDILQRIVDHAAARLMDGEGRVFDAVDITTGTPQGVADLHAQAALTAGLLAAAEQLGSNFTALFAGLRAAEYLLEAFGNGEGMFGDIAGQAASSYSAQTLTEVLAALRLAAATGLTIADDDRSRLLDRLRPALAFAEWEGHGEVFGDGIADTDGDGLPEPSAAGGAHGRLPLIADRITVGPAAAPTSRGPLWTEHVRPLLLQKCGECHLNGNENGGYRLDTLRSLATPGESQGQFPMLVPGDADASFFFQKLSSRQPPLGTQMPQGRTPLDASSVSLIREWIDSGASAR